MNQFEIMSDIQKGDRVRVTGNHAQAGREGTVTSITKLSLQFFGTMKKAVVSLDSGYTPDIPLSALSKIEESSD